MAFHEMKSILRNYKTFSEDLLGNINLIMLEAPAVPEKPGNPVSDLRRILQVMALAGAGVAAGLGLLSYMRDTVRTPADVEQKLDTHILATLYHEQKYGSILSRIRNWRRKTSILITDPVTSFRYTESVKRMAARIVSRMNSRKAKVLMLTSVLENEGKSTVAANIALAIADEGRKVLLVDADLRKPSLYKILKMQDQEFVSLTKVLRAEDPADIRQEDLCVPVPGTALKAVLNRSGAPQSMEMFSSGRFVELLDLFRREYDYIIVDTPPMQLVADAEEMAPVADACAMVIRQHTVEARDINDALDALNGNKDHVIGCIFNNVHSGLPLPGSGRGYGYGYGYGNYGYGGHYGKTS
jgi:capsular exopolysaccharide synthesis family protein